MRAQLYSLYILLVSRHFWVGPLSLSDRCCHNAVYSSLLPLIISSATGLGLVTVSLLAFRRIVFLFLSGLTVSRVLALPLAVISISSRALLADRADMLETEPRMIGDLTGMEARAAMCPAAA